MVHYGSEWKICIHPKTRVLFRLVMTYLSDLKANTNTSDRMSVENNSKNKVRDDEQALYTLLQSDFNVDEAVRRKKLQTTPPSGMTNVTHDQTILYRFLSSIYLCGRIKVMFALCSLVSFQVSIVDPLSLWSEEECQNFESGLRVYGKNFFAIHQNKVVAYPTEECHLLDDSKFNFLW